MSHTPRLTKRILTLFAAALFAVEAICVFSGGDGTALAAFAYGPTELTNGVYRLSIATEKQPRGEIMSYVPRFSPVDRRTADSYAAMFGVSGAFSETGDAYEYTGPAGSLEVEKWLSAARYEGNPDAFTRDTPLASDEDAVSAAVAFAKSKRLRLSYEETKVKFDGSVYEISFIDRIGNLKNYAFPTDITLDSHGNVLSMDYFFIQYDKLKPCATISMADAFLCLPPVPDLTGAGGTAPLPSVLIDRAQLVYYYENSIVQPAYLFEGQAAGGKAYECFIKAAKYD
ncbi:MAG: hypothetical protein FWF44_01920 [Defluviitaleaceae bacterium]|nr:hypothetical protein [Defluviitaleaceae bacterium]